MPKRINEDHEDFRNVVSGRTRRELKRLIKTGAIVRQRGKGGKLQITIPRIDIPRFLFGDTGEELGRGKGKKGDVIHRDPKRSQGAGDQSADGITITLDLDEVLRFLQEDLHLPDMKPRPSDIYEQVKIVYNDISRIGPESLRHTRRTLLETLKRLAAQNTLDDLVKIPGHVVPMRILTPINSDRRYRQYREIKIPASNAIIFFARDCSGSMDDYRCDIVSDMAWWIDCWIRKFYERVERCYLIHDTEAEVVDEDKFYKYRFGGGTQVSSVFKEIAKLLENKYQASQYNVYIFYFSDGDNLQSDNETMKQVIAEQLSPNIVNLLGFTQICPYSQENLKDYLEEQISQGVFNPNFLRIASIASTGDNSDGFMSHNMPDEERDEQIIRAIKLLLSKDRKVVDL